MACSNEAQWVQGLETAQEFRARSKAVVAEINRVHDVENLCWELPERVQEVKAMEGGRIGKSRHTRCALRTVDDQKSIFNFEPH